MSLRSQIQIETYLQELIQDRESSRLKLLAAWDGLSIEAQIKILNTVKQIPHQLKLKALSSPNDYVRYLVAEHFCFSGLREKNEEKELFEKISTDKNVIIRFTQSQSQKIYDSEKNEYGHIVAVLKPENFFAMTKEEQILYFSKCSIREGDEIAAIIEWGLNNNAVEEIHLDNLIIECAANFEKFEPFIYDYDYSGNKGLEALWKLLPKLGLTKSAKYLIWSLPPEILGSNKISDEVLNSLDSKLLIELLNRQDVYLCDFRKKIVFSSIGEYSEEDRIAAASIHLDLTKDNINNLIQNKNSDVINIIIKSGKDGNYWHSYGLPPVYIHALIDFQKAMQGNYEYGSYLYNFDKFFSANTENYDSGEEKNELVKEELCKLATYFLARMAVPWVSNQKSSNKLSNILRGKFSFLKKVIVQGNTWKTYMAFSRVLDPEYYGEDLLSYVNHSKFSSALSIAIAPGDPEKLFGNEGREGDFIQDKIDYLYKEISKLTRIYDSIICGFKNLLKYLIIIAIIWGLVKLLVFFN